MEVIGYVVVDSTARALTAGSRGDMEAWAELNKTVDSTTALYTVKAGDDVEFALVDQPYFQSLVNAS